MQDMIRIVYTVKLSRTFLFSKVRTLIMVGSWKLYFECKIKYIKYFTCYLNGKNKNKMSLNNASFDQTNWNVVISSLGVFSVWLKMTKRHCKFMLNCNINHVNCLRNMIMFIQCDLYSTLKWQCCIRIVFIPGTTLQCL